MRVEFFIDPASGWTLWTSPSLAATEPRADEDHTDGIRRPPSQGLLLRLLGRWTAGSAAGSRPRQAPGFGSGPAVATPGNRAHGAITARPAAGGADDQPARRRRSSPGAGGWC